MDTGCQKDQNKSYFSQMIVWGMLACHLPKEVSTKGVKSQVEKSVVLGFFLEANPPGVLERVTQ